MSSMPSSLPRSSTGSGAFAALVALAALAGLVPACGDDGSPAIDAAGGLDAPTDSAAADAAIDGNQVDASPVDAAIDAAPPAMINGCTLAAAADRTAVNAARTVTFPGFAYTPRCIKIRVGQTVTWSGDLAFHPLRPGLIVGGVPMAQAGNPVPSVSAGASTTATFAAAGDYGYYCANHFGSGMVGAVYVVP